MSSSRLFRPLAVALALTLAAIVAAPASAADCPSPYICVQPSTTDPAIAYTPGDIALGVGAWAGDYTLNSYPLAGGSSAMAIGTNAQAPGLQSIAQGMNSRSDSNQAIAIGDQSHAGNGDYGYDVMPDGTLQFHAGGQIALGDQSTATAVGSMALGVFSVSTGEQSVAVGYGATSSGTGSTALGPGAEASGDFSSALGVGATSQGNQAVAIGWQSQATQSNSVAIGSFSVADQADTVSFGNASLQRRLINVAGGVADTDAVTVGQLYGFASALGGGATWAGGSLTAPSFSLTGGTFHDVGSALSYLDDRISGLPTTTPTPPPTDDTVVHYDGSDKNQVTLAGADGTRVSNVADGVEATDAANVRQVQTAKQEAIDAANSYADAGDARTLNSAERYADQGDAAVKDWAKAYTDDVAARTLRDANAYTDMRFKQLNDRFARVNAMGSAQTSMAANFRGDNSVSAGVGFSGGHNAIAVGYRHVTKSGHVSFSVHGAIAGSERTVGAGVGYSW